MKIINAMVYSPRGTFEKRDVCTSADRIMEKSDDETVIDGSGCYLVPGLTDMHFHGCAGHDFCDGTPEAIEAIAAYQAFEGITTIFPATMTLDEDSLLQIVRTAASFSGRDGADLVGIHMEGPFLSREKKGSQNPAYLRRPDTAFFRKLNDAAGGMIRILTMAPELEGACQCIRELKGEVILSVGHTGADYDTACRAFQEGASHVTHLYNAMTPQTHRNPGVVGAAADCGHVFVELICDGMHLHPSVVRQAFKVFGQDRIIMVSDSMEATGMADGRYALGGQTVYKKGNAALLEDGTIAASVTNLMDCLRTAVNHMGIPLESALKAAAVNPAVHTGIYDRYGSIEEGKTANLVLLDRKDLSTRLVVLKGRIIRGERPC